MSDNLDQLRRQLPAVVENLYNSLTALLDEVKRAESIDAVRASDAAEFAQQSHAIAERFLKAGVK